jgi:small-conductance mechanosensitive channel
MESDLMNRAKAWMNDPLTGQLILVGVGVVVIYALSHFLLKNTLRLVKGSQTKYYVNKFFKFGSFILIFIFIGIVFSDKLKGLTVALGLAGAGIAFALQEVIVSVAGWAAIAFGGYYRTGDRIQLGGISGDVIDIGILRTTIMECGQWVKADLYTGRVVRVANSFVFKEPVFNYSGDFPFLWDEITIPIKFGSDYNLVRTILKKIADQKVGEYSGRAKSAWLQMVNDFRIENSVVEPVVTLIFNDNWIEFTLRYIVDYKLRRTTKDLLFTSILDEFSLHADKLSLASATIEVVAIPPLNISVPPGAFKKSDAI